MQGARATKTIITSPDSSLRKFSKDFEDKQDALPRPFVKWAGGKRQLLNILQAAAPGEFGRYHEPFVGGGAFLFSMLPSSATISDANVELINCYRVIHDDVHSLINHLTIHKNEEEYFYNIRSSDLKKLTDVERASRFIFLNKTCFNGLYRENLKGQFNVPFGRYGNPKILDKNNLIALSDYLNRANIEIYCGSYKTVMDRVSAGDFVYFDPPYAPMTKTANFSQYLKGGFGLDDQAELASLFVELTHQGVKVMLSNSNTEIIHELYRGFNIRNVHATRSINCNASGRAKYANEVLVTNY